MTNNQRNAELYFSISNIKGAIVRKLLDKTGWSTIEEYEFECNNENQFLISIKNGVMDNQPNFFRCTSDNFHTQQISLHHLDHSLQDIILWHTEYSNCTEYEVYNSLNNAIYISMPYKSFWMKPRRVEDNLVVNGTGFKPLKKNEAVIINEQKPSHESKPNPDGVKSAIEGKQFFSFGGSNHNHINTGYPKYLDGMYFTDLDEHSLILYKPCTFKQEWSCIKYWNNLEKTWECYPLVFNTSDLKAEWVSEKRAWVVSNESFETLSLRGAVFINNQV